MRIFGIILIAIGILMLIYRGFSFTQEKKVLDIGPLELNKKETKTVAWHMIAGAFAIAAGAFILIRKKTK